MAPTTVSRVYLTPAEVRDRMRVNLSKVIMWIRSGELVATNVATRNGGRPRWRIAEADLAAFVASRAAVPPAPSTPRRRRIDAGVKAYF